MKWFIIWLFMPFLEIPLSVLNIIFVIRKYGWKSLGDYFKDSCINKDVYGAREYRTALNTLFKGVTGRGFGWSGLTISYELGYMVRDYIYTHLKLKGWILEELLNLLDKEHSIKAFNNLEGKKNVIGYLKKKVVQNNETKKEFDEVVETVEKYKQ
jgi:hypothetical protein